MDPAARNDSAPAGNNIVGINNTLNGNISQGEIHLHQGANFILNAYAPVNVSKHAGALSNTQQGQGALHPGGNNPPAPAPYHSGPYHKLLTQQSPEWATKYQPGNLHLLTLILNDFRTEPEDELGYAARPTGNTHGRPTVSQAIWTILRRTPGRGMASASLAKIYADWLGIDSTERATRTVNQTLSREKDLFIKNGKPDALIGTKTNKELWRIKLVDEPLREAGAGGYHTTEKGKRAGADSQSKTKFQAAQENTDDTTFSARRGSTGGPRKRKVSQSPVSGGDVNRGQRKPPDGPASKIHKARTSVSISKQSTKALPEHGSIEEQLSGGNLTPGEVEAIHGLLLFKTGDYPRNQPAVVSKRTDRLDGAGVCSKGWNGDSEQGEEEAENVDQEPLQEEYLVVEEGATLLKDFADAAHLAGFTSAEADEVDARVQASLRSRAEADAT